jgi:predicted transcriptional regulator
VEDLRHYTALMYTNTDWQRRASVIYFEAKPLCWAAMMREKKLTVLSIRVDDTLAQAIKELAAEDERPVSTYLERIIRQHAQAHGKDVLARPPRAAEQGPRPKKPARKGGKL